MVGATIATTMGPGPARANGVGGGLGSGRKKVLRGEKGGDKVKRKGNPSRQF